MKFRTAAFVLAAICLASCSTTPPAAVKVTVPPPPRYDPAYKWTNGFAAKARDAAFAAFGPNRLKPGEYRWAETMPAAGNTKVVVDLLTQTAFVYRGEQVVGMTTISSGKKGHETPLGFWSVERKRKVYRSRKYQNAPMPFAQIIDDHGIALHGGAIPGYPASHGCVRLPVKFAERLFAVTEVGTKVVIEG